MLLQDGSSSGELGEECVMRGAAQRSVSSVQRASPMRSLADAELPSDKVRVVCLEVLRSERRRLYYLVQVPLLLEMSGAL